MQATGFDLAKLLMPIELDTFVRESWEKHPLHVARNDPGHYRGLYSLQDVDNVIAFSRPKFLEPADFKPGPPPVHNFVQGNLADDEPIVVEYYPGISEIHQAFTLGKTIIITNIQQRWGPVATLCRNLEAFFGCPVHGNMYLTPKGAQGFSPHYDTHDVFVLQIEGSKHWRFYGSGPALPLVDDPTPVRKENLGVPTLEVVVQPGDLLYMPRGHIHEAFTSTCLSMHLTVGVKVFRWANLLQQAVNNVSAEDVRFRESLPTGALVNDQTLWAMKGRFRELLKLFAQSARAEEALERLGSTFLAGLPMLPNNTFLKSEEAERINLDTELEKAPGVIYQIIQGEDGISLEYPGNRLDGPLKIAASLRFIATSSRFTVQAMPDDLTMEGRLLLVRRLVRDGFLTVVNTPAPTL